MKKEANWLPFVTLKAERNPLQRRKLAELHGHKNVDLLLQAQSHFIKAHDHEVIVALLQCCFSEFTALLSSFFVIVLLFFVWHSSIAMIDFRFCGLSLNVSPSSE